MTHAWDKFLPLKLNAFPLLLMTKISSISSACLSQEQYPRLGTICPLHLASQKVMCVYSLSLAQQWKLYINSRKAVWADWSSDLWLIHIYILKSRNIPTYLFMSTSPPPNESQLTKGIVFAHIWTRTANLGNTQMLTSTSLVTSKIQFIRCISEKAQLLLLLI